MNNHKNRDNNPWIDISHPTCFSTESRQTNAIGQNDLSHTLDSDLPRIPSELFSPSKAKTVVEAVRKHLIGLQQSPGPGPKLRISQQLPRSLSQPRLLMADADADDDESVDSLCLDLEDGEGMDVSPVPVPPWLNNSSRSILTFQSIPTATTRTATTTTTTATTTTTLSMTNPQNPKVSKAEYVSPKRQTDSGDTRNNSTAKATVTATASRATMTTPPAKTPQTTKKTLKIPGHLLSSIADESLSKDNDKSMLPRFTHGFLENGGDGEEDHQEQGHDTKRSKKTATNTILKIKVTKKKTTKKKQSLNDSYEFSNKKDRELGEVDRMDYSGETVFTTTTGTGSRMSSPHREEVATPTKFVKSKDDNKVNVKMAMTPTRIKMKNKLNRLKELVEEEDGEDVEESIDDNNGKSVAESRRTITSKTTKKSSVGCCDLTSINNSNNNNVVNVTTTSTTTRIARPPGLPIYIEFKVKSNNDEDSDDDCSAVTIPRPIRHKSNRYDNKNKEEGSSPSKSSSRLTSSSSHSASHGKSTKKSKKSKSNNNDNKNTTNNKNNRSCVLVNNNHDNKNRTHPRSNRIPLEPDGIHLSAQ